MVKSLSKLLKIYDQSVGNNAQLLLNLPPTPEGLLHHEDVKRLKDLGEILRRTYVHNLADEAHIEVVEDQEVATWTVNFEEPVAFNTLVLGEDIRQGQLVEAFEVEVKQDGVWQPVAKGTIIGYKKILRIVEKGTLIVEAVRLHMTKMRGLPHLKTIGIYRAPIIVSAPEMHRDCQGRITIESLIPGEIYYTVDGQVPTQAHTRYTGPFELPRGGMVKAIAYYDEVPADYFVEEDAIGTTLFGIPVSERCKFTQKPCIIEADLGVVEEIKGLTMMPIQEGYDFNYNVTEYSFWVSEDGKVWDCVHEKQYFHNISHNPILQVINLEQTVKARYIRFEAHNGLSGDGCIVVGELGVLRANR